MTFELDPVFHATCRPLADLPLCRAMLGQDSNYPWIVLVPRRASLRELTDLEPADRAALWPEIDAAARAVSALCAPDRPMTKLNVASLGNLVAQLHIHVIARRTDDPAWPGPVWGVATPQPYDDFDAALDVARTALLEP